MHMISKKVLNSAEMDTLTKSCSPTIVITANGEVQTHEEATVYVTELDIFLSMKVLENTPAVLSLGKLCDENGYSYEWINGQKPHLIKNVVRIQCNTENFVPIVVPGLSASSSSSSHSSTSMTPSRHEINHPTSSSSSSTSPTTTVLSDSETRAREDLSGIDSHPVPVSSSHVEQIERGDPLYSDIPEWLQEFKENLVDDKVFLNAETHTPVLLMNHPLEPMRSVNLGKRGDPLCSDNSEIPEWLQEFRENLVDDEIPEHGDSHASSSHEASFSSPYSRDVRIFVNTVFILTSLKTEIARSVRGPKLQVPRAEDALAEPYLVQKILVTW